ncbi:Putative F-box domain, leucine-rich repeat domain superfamily, F-box-like domain superfamily [Colletotrichum destructivum]|uniref:F-box domain, leucine-rich repeat domain superfamily, F-box-like domain superfamily n=1 Tax=Colletotrichum destructivum TaxID=34406 RepID=A0AAX4J4E9_9PEZI|nr:Putative F-box domain, leucine-rich repeat domain superfamily, F-box-like domain superfamily [Colletotrichum destructivum]
MHKLPTEILLLIFRSLRLSDLSRASRCCRFFHALATPELFGTLRIRMKSHTSDRQIIKLLSTFMQPSYLHRLLQRIEVVVDDDRLWTRENSLFLGISLRHILDRSGVPEGIRSYRWSAAYPFTGVVFPNLQRLDCGAVGPQSIEWVRWHLNHCASLAEVQLSFTLSCNLTQSRASALLNRANFSGLKRLSLTFINVALFDPKKAHALTTLDLRYCPGAESFCQRLAVALPPDLRELRILAYAESGRPDNFTAWLRSARNVQHVALCIGGLSDIIPFEQVRGHRSTLRTLVLDPRRNLLDPSSVLKYRPADLREIVEQCISLRTLGLPLDLRDYQFQFRYTRSHQICAAAQSYRCQTPRSALPPQTVQRKGFDRARKRDQCVYHDGRPDDCFYQIVEERAIPALCRIRPTEGF